LLLLLLPGVAGQQQHAPAVAAAVLPAAACAVSAKAAQLLRPTQAVAALSPHQQSHLHLLLLLLLGHGQRLLLLLLLLCYCTLVPLLWPALNPEGANPAALTECAIATAAAPLSLHTPAQLLLLLSRQSSPDCAD
jgi:hypothetical protein